jgi:hypothetical protein
MGHAYEGTTADVIARFARLHHRSSSTTINNDDESSDVGGRPYFVTGADEHGEKIAKTAEVEGKAPIDICNKVCCVCIIIRTCSLFVFDSILLLLILKCLSLQYRNNISNLSHYPHPLYT